MKKLFLIVAVLIAALALAVPALPQNPQSSTAPLYAVNAKYSNGVAPGYWPTQLSIPNGTGGTIAAATGLNVNIGPGTANCGSGTIISYVGGTKSLTASATNRVYLDTTSSCAVSVKTTAFASTDIPLAVIVTNGTGIATNGLTDVRTPFTVPPIGSSFTAGQDLSGSSSSQTVIGIQGHLLPTLASGYPHWTGSAWVYDTPSGGSDIYSGYIIAHMGDSRWTYNGGRQYTTVTPFTSCDGTNCVFTVNPTFANNGPAWGIGDYIAFETVPGISCLNWSMSKITALTGTTFTVAENTTLCSGSQTGTGAATLDYGNFTTPGMILNSPVLNGIYLGQNFAQAGQTVCGMVTQYNTSAHLISPAVTSKPGVLILEGGANDLLNGSTPSAIETCWQNLWVAAHADGWIIQQNSLIPLPLNTDLPDAGFPNLIKGLRYSAQLNRWIKTQVYENNSTNPPVYGTKYYDRFADVASALYDFNGSQAGSDRLHPITAGSTTERDVNIHALQVQKGFPLNDTAFGANKYIFCTSSGGTVGPSGICEGFEDINTGTRWDRRMGGAGMVEDYNDVQVLTWVHDVNGNVELAINNGAGIGLGGTGDGGGYVGPSADLSNNKRIDCSTPQTGFGIIDPVCIIGTENIEAKLGDQSGSCTNTTSSVRWHFSTANHIQYCPLGGGTWQTFAASGAAFPSSPTTGVFFYTSTTGGRAATASDTSALQYAADTGAADAYVVTLAPPITAYADGLVVRFLPSAANLTTTPTLAVNGLTASTIVRSSGSAVVAGDLSSLSVAIVVRKGTTWQLQNPQNASVPTFTATSPIQVDLSVPGTVNYKCPTCSVGSGTGVNHNGGSTEGSLNINGMDVQKCTDVSGSGTAQSCTTANSYTLTAPNCFVYTTTTANSGTGLTLAVNGGSAKPVAIASSTGWSTTLSTSPHSIPAGEPMIACYDGTNINMAATGVVPSAGTSGPNITPSLTPTNCTVAGNVCVTSGSVASVSFSGINTACSAGGRLHVDVDGTGAAQDGLYFQINGDTGNNYFYAGASGGSSVPGARVGLLNNSVRTMVKFDIDAPESTTLQKYYLSPFSVVTDNSVNQQYFGHWSGTAAITSITIFLGANTISSGTAIMLSCL